MPNKHARLSASSSRRWLTCPPIIHLEELVSKGQSRTSSYAREGTDAHRLAELKLQDYLGGDREDAIKEFKKDSSWYDQEMEEATDLYRDYVVELYNNHGDLASIALEQEVSFDKYVPGGFGTSDVVITSPGRIEIVDLKYGKGIKVEAYQNPQLMLYALGAYEKFDFVYDFDTVTMTIVQPRLDHLDSFTVHKDELLYWAENYVAPRASLADQGIGEWNITEDVLRFSDVRGRLRPQYEQNKEFIEKYEYKEGAVLDSDELTEILDQADQIKRWIKDVEDFALKSLLDGKDVPGYKVVEGRSNRKISDEAGLAKVLKDQGYSDEEIYKEPKLETLGRLEKLVGKQAFEDLSSDFIIKPEGKPTLAPANDKRQSLYSAEEDFKNL